MRDVETAIGLARELDSALASSLRVLRVVQYGGAAAPDELRRIADMGERVRNRAAGFLDDRTGNQRGLAPGADTQKSMPDFGLGSPSDRQGRRP